MNHKVHEYLRLRMLRSFYTCRFSGTYKIFLELFFSSRWRKVCRTLARLNTRFQGLKKKKMVARAKRMDPALPFRSNNADFDIGKFRLKMERDSCQRMPRSKLITFERLMLPVRHLSLDHMCILVSPFCRLGKMNWRKKKRVHCKSSLLEKSTCRWLKDIL